MAYIDTKYLFKCETCRNFRSNVCRTFCESGEGYAPSMSKIPTADVVPRVAVERLQAEVDRLKKDNEYILMQHRFQRRPSGDCWNDVIEKAKAEVAREIFEEVQKTLIFGADRMRIAELKKKYTDATDTNDGHKAGEQHEPNFS